MKYEHSKWEAISKLFPINQSKVWLNNCGVSPANIYSISRIKSHFDDFSENGIYLKKDNLSQINLEIKYILSELLNCSPKNLALIHNTAEGANNISYGLSLKKGDEILLLEDEYPSNYYPWLHWKESGVHIAFLQSASSPKEYEENFSNTITDKTKVVSLSSVHWCTGIPLPVQKIASICIKNNIHFFLDGAQGIGHIPIDLKNISFCAFSAWKWLLGPAGLGVLYISDEALEDLKPVFTGPGSVENPMDYLPYKKIKSSVDRYEFSTSSFSDWIYFHESLKLLQSIGWTNYFSYIYNLAQALHEKLHDLGFILCNQDIANIQSAIISCYHPDINLKTVHDILSNNNIICAIRANRIRFSPHLPNTNNHIDYVYNTLKKHI